MTCQQSHTPSRRNPMLARFIQQDALGAETYVSTRSGHHRGIEPIATTRFVPQPPVSFRDFAS